MRRVAALVILGLAAALASTAAANRPQPFQWGQHDGFLLYRLDGNVPGAVNPTGCAWNDQDTLFMRGGGVVADTVMGDLCLIADWHVGLYPKVVKVRVIAPADTVTVELRNDHGDRWTLTPAALRNDVVWQTCVVDPVAATLNVPPLENLPLVEGSNGGRGVPVTYTVEVVNVGRKASQVSAEFDITYAGDIGPAYPLQGIPC